ncbi:hypothetical protein ACHAXT_013202 [Thalassiosira profunda]
MAAKKKSKGIKQQKKSAPPDEKGDAAPTNGNGPAHKSSAPKGAKGEDLIEVSPSRVRYQHSRIRPHFSGCGRRVTDTLDEIREGKLEPGDLPPIQVLIGPDAGDGCGPWYFSLNNRRLWVLKQCHKEGLLERYGNKISVRVRVPKSAAEAERYTVEKCALEAKFMRDGGGSKKKGNAKKGVGQSETERDDDSPNDGSNEAITEKVVDEDTDERENKEDDGSDSESESDDDVAHQNPFSALL